MKKLTPYLLLAILLLFNACSDDDDPKPKGDYEYGYFITNEGPFQNGSGTITFVGDDGVVEQGIYKKVNGQDLGNIVNTMHISGSQAYIVVNNSHKVVVADRYTMEDLGEISGSQISNPRHFVSYSGKGYLSNWGDPFVPTDDSISVIDLGTNEVISTISVSEGPERMLTVGNQLWVLMQGGYGYNNEVVIIDMDEDEILETIKLTDVPNSIVLDDDGMVWILCGGKPAWTQDETVASLFTINPVTFETSGIGFADGAHPSSLNYENDYLYFALNGEVYKKNTGSLDLPTEPLDGLSGSYYYMTVRNDMLYGTDAGDFASEGSMKVIAITSGSLIETIPTGIIPGAVVFP